MSKNTLLVTAIWCALAALIFYFADNIQNPNKLDNMGKSNHVVLKRGLDGHYRAQALINGEQVDVLVDTGATGVAISQRIADKLKLKSINAVRLQSVQIGGIQAHDVAAMIAPSLDGDVLLGMSFLGRMDVRLYKGEMSIKQVAE